MQIVSNYRICLGVVSFPIQILDSGLHAQQKTNSLKQSENYLKMKRSVYTF